MMNPFSSHEDQHDEQNEQTEWERSGQSIYWKVALGLGLFIGIGLGAAVPYTLYMTVLPPPEGALIPDVTTTMYLVAAGLICAFPVASLVGGIILAANYYHWTKDTGSDGTGFWATSESSAEKKEQGAKQNFYSASWLSISQKPENSDTLTTHDAVKVVDTLKKVEKTKNSVLGVFSGWMSSSKKTDKTLK